jgi:23S rRNA (uracil1939-C5)-methyltransferase
VPILKKGSILKLKIHDLAHGGDGVARTDSGRTVFISRTVPGDLVEAKVTKIKKNYAFANLKKIIKPAANRIEPPCPVFQTCGGCQLQQLDYQAELELKTNNIKQLVNRIGGINNFKLNPVQAAAAEFRYRNKAQFPLAINKAGKITAGFYQRGSHKVVPYHDCLIQHPLINRILKVTLAELNKAELTVYNEHTLQGLLRHLVIRVGFCTNQALLVLVTNRLEFKEKKAIARSLMKQIPELKGIMQNVNSANTNVIFGQQDLLLAGKAKIKEYIGKTVYSISARSFFQVNTMQAEKLYSKVVSYLEAASAENVIDAFSGTGSIALYLAEKVKQIYAIESLPQAVTDAKFNAELNQIEKIKFIQGQVEKELPALVAENEIDTIIFDPPRKGLAAETLELLKNVNIATLIYISCNPATQARDLAILKTDYNLVEIQPVDLFPQTYHLESIALLKSKK